MLRSREEALTALAAEKPPSERMCFLDRECAGDAELRRRIEEHLSVIDLQGRTSSTVSVALRDGTGPESPGALIGKYKLLERLGDGGFGVVWAAEQKEPVKRRVALKIIKLGMDTEQVVARFEAERQALAMMDHPNIAKVLDAGATQYGRPYFVMELVKGVPITRYCDQEKLSVEARLALFIKTCHAIQHAHQKGIIHRDIKPSNILVTMHDGVPVPKVIDFGIAKATQAELTEKTIYTQYGQFIGTPAYMSPEQAEMSGLDIDTRSDIYSLGVLLYEMLTGSTPFDTEELVASGVDGMRKIIREREPVRPSTRLRRTGSTSSGSTPEARHPPRHIGFSTDLDWIVMKCLEKDRTRRYETANGLAMDLVRHLNDEPVTARPQSALYKLRKAWRRNRVVYTAGAVVFVALAVGVIGLSIGIHSAGIEQDKAKEAARSALVAAGEAEAARALAETNAKKLETALYFDRIALAHREITAQPQNVKHSEALLDECPEALRGWEWRHLKRRRFAEPLVLDDPDSRYARSVTFSPDGRFLAWGSTDGKLRVWSLAENRMAQTVPAHTGSVVSVAFSPVNPRWIASAGDDGTVRLWDWQSPLQLHGWPADAGRGFGTAYAVAFSPDGKLLGAPGNGGEFLIRLTETGRDAMSLKGHERTTLSAAFSPDGRWIATGSAGGAVRLWETATGQEVSTLSNKAPPISGLAFTRDSKNLISLEFHGLLRIWDVEGRRELSSYSVRMLGAAPSVALAVLPDGKRVATGGFDRLVTLSEMDTGRQVLVLREIDSSCHCVTFSPDGNRLAAATASGKVYLWDASSLSGSEDPSATTYRHVSKEVWAIDISPHRLAVAAGGIRAGPGSSAPVLLWHGLEDRDPMRLPGYAIVVFSVAFDPTGRFLATAGDEPLRPGKANIKIWDLESKREALEVEAVDSEGRFLAVAISPDGRRLMGGGNDRKVVAWEAPTGKKIGVIGEHEGQIVALAFSKNGKYLASSGYENVVQVWDGARLDELQPDPRRFSGYAAAIADVIAFSPDEQCLAVIEDDDTVVLHDLEGPDRAVRLKSQGHGPTSLAFYPNGLWVITGGKDCALKIWDRGSGALRHTLKSHTDHVTRLRAARFASGSWLVSGSRDGTVKLWDLDSIERKLESR